MSTSIPAEVEPSVLRWARESAGLVEVAAARKIKVPDDRVRAWEAGQAQPTVAQLRRAAEVYQRSLAVFFLPAPPEGFDTLRDFRRHPGEQAASWSPELHGEYRRAHQQREQLLELAELEDYALPTAWHLAPLPEQDEALASAARRLVLDASPLGLPGGRGGSPYDHVNAWVAGLEQLGVLVMTTAGGRVLTTEMRGFSLYFDELPVIVVNGADFPRGRLFTLLHEYAHLLLHSEGLCELVTDTRPTTPDARLEARCNALAAAMLMPPRAVAASPAAGAGQDPAGWDYKTLAGTAAPFGVSAEAFLRRLTTLGHVTTAAYEQRREEFLAAYEVEESRAKPPGGNFYWNKARDLGKGYVRRVADARTRRVIDSYTAATFLDVKVGQIDQLAAAAALRERA